MFSHSGNLGSFENVSFLPRDPTNPRNFLKLLIDDIGLTKGEINAIFKGGITMKKVEDWLINEMRLKEEPATLYNKVVSAGNNEIIYGMVCIWKKYQNFVSLEKYLLN